MINFLEYLSDPSKLISFVGLVGIVLIVFVETGLLVGFFLPGDSLLITAGLFAARGDISIVQLIIFTFLAAVIGDATGFYIGKRLGKLLYTKEDSFIFKKKHIKHAHEFYEKHGGKTIIIARFVPIIRTFAPTVAGAAHMKYSQFFAYNVIGAFFWITSMCLGGYYLGHLFGEHINNYIHIIIMGVILLSFLPIIWQWILVRKKSKSGA